MKQVVFRAGKGLVKQISKPSISDNELLIKLRTSCVSPGTEGASIRDSGASLLEKLLADPKKISQAKEMLRQGGVRDLYTIIKNKKLALVPSGYSASGNVVEVGENVAGFAIGDAVACAGALYANHAEYVRCVPNLTCKLPETLSFKYGSTVTLGAIALQGIRRAQPSLGETFVVLGLGLLGQLTSQMLLANGCTVYGFDPDNSRLENALATGLTGKINLIDYQDVMLKTNGVGADGVIITASSESSDLISSAFKLCRKKGRVVVVGDVGLNLKRADFYQNEIDLYISCSYGPGRYDYKYEELGIDYPIGYVRWTENRNMRAYLNLAATGRIDLINLKQQSFLVDESAQALVKASESLLTFIDYAALDTPEREQVTAVSHKVTKRKSTQLKPISIALIGAGAFAHSTHLPNLERSRKKGTVSLEMVSSKNGVKSAGVAEIYGFSKSTTGFQEILSESSIEAVIISAPHDLHGELVLKALEVGKHVFCDKPLALKGTEIDDIESFYSRIEVTTNQKPILLTGYNRRFSPCFKLMKDFTKEFSSPFILNYTINAGFVGYDHWVNREQGGGRNLGEACHIYDFFVALAGSPVKSISAHSTPDMDNYYHRNENFCATIAFDNGSVCNLIYTSMGNKTKPKETAQLFINGKIAEIMDYCSFKVDGEEKLLNRKVNKGHSEIFDSFVNSIMNKENPPIPIREQITASRISIEIEKLIFERYDR